MATAHAVGIQSKQNQHGDSCCLFETYQFKINGSYSLGAPRRTSSFASAYHTPGVGSIADVPLSIFKMALDEYVSAFAAERGVRGGGVRGPIIIVCTRLLELATLLGIDILGGSLQYLA